MKVAVVRNRNKDGIINRFGQLCPEVYGPRSVQNVIDALRQTGHTVAFFEGDKRLLANLEQFMPSDPATGMPGGLAFNMSYGIQGDARYTHVPAMLEMAGVPYTGSTPLGHALALDKVVTKVLMQDAGVPTPRYRVMSRADQRVDGLRFPLIVKPRHESTSFGLHLVQNALELEQAVAEVIAQYQQDALVEEYIEGREVAVGLLGNDPVEFLPLVELDFSGREFHAMTWADKYHKTPDEPKKICPAPVSEEMADLLRKISLDTFRACRCKDYSRVDIRIDPSGRPFVLEINSMASLGTGGAFVLAAKTAGYTFQSLISRIVDVAHYRTFGTLAPIGETASTSQAGSLEAATTEAEYSFRESIFSEQQMTEHHIPPYKVTRFYDEQTRRSGYPEPLKRIVEPSLAELESSGSLDTSGESDHTKVRGLQHKYPGTALLLVTDQCFSYCRFCFRKRLVGKSSQEVVVDYGKVSEYLKEHPEIQDILLSGGDPFVLGTEQLHAILDYLLPIPHLTSIRFGTRSFVYYPSRFHDKGFGDLFRRITTAGKIPVIVTHIDHIGEVSQEADTAIRKLLTQGVQFFNQTVLLREINDDPDILAALFCRLHALGVRPYYLFQARPVKGASHFQVPLRQGVEIVRDVNAQLSGLHRTFRYIMSHATGKIEILGMGKDDRLWMRYHQSRDPQKLGKVFSRPYKEGACWLDDLPRLSKVQGKC